MTMIIDKNATTYKDYVAIKHLLKTYSKEDIELIKNRVENTPLLQNTDINTLLSIEGIDLQIESFTKTTGLVFYPVLTRGVNDTIVSISKLPLISKEVEDDWVNYDETLDIT